MKSSKDTILESLVQYANIVLWFFVFGVGIRYFEYKLLSATDILPADQCLTANEWGVLLDVCRFALANVVLLPVFLLISLWKSKVANVLFRCIFAIAIMASCGMVAYYSVSGVPLDNVVFAYSLTELKVVVESCLPPTWSIYYTILTPIVFLFASHFKIFRNKIVSIGLLVLLFGVLMFRPERIKGNVDFELKKMTENKLYYFANSIINDGEMGIEDANILDAVSKLHKYFPEYKFLNQDYPFLHKNTTPDVLSQYFNKAETAPNIVIIICEGLGRAFSGPNSVETSATPFLDSLACQGLFWGNCYSTTQRSSGALPAILGSLPLGKGGFMRNRANMPNFQSLISILKDNGYYVNYFYGGDNEDHLLNDGSPYFFRANNVDFIFNSKEIDTIETHQSYNGAFGGALHDEYLFRYAHNYFDNTQKPRLDVFVTITTHVPFENCPHQEEYTEKYKQKLPPNHDLSERVIHCNASFQYLDDCIHEFMQTYQKRSDFEKTIFVITGDHSYATWSSSLSYPNIPLIIWSPLLKTHRNFPAVVSHRSITPSLLEMLRSQYNLQTPEEVTYLNSGLDTSATFRCELFSPIMDVGNNLEILFYKGLVLDQGETYKISCDSLNRPIPIKIEDNQKLKDFGGIYKSVDNYIMTHDALLPKTQKDSCLSLVSINHLSPLWLKENEENEHFKEYEGMKRTKRLLYEYPFNIIKYTATGTEKSIRFSLNSKMIMPWVDSATNKGKVLVVTQVARGGENLYWKKEYVNPDSLINYNKWFDFSQEKTIDFRALNIQPDDEVSVYLWNPSKRPLFIANLQLEAKVYFQAK